MSKSCGQYTLTRHAWERVQQRYNITDKTAADQFISQKINRGKKTKTEGDKTYYVEGNTEIIVGSANKVITIYESIHEIHRSEFLSKVSKSIEKEAKKFIAKYSGEIRKIDIEIAEFNLNRLKARNPKTKQLITDRLMDAMQRKDDVIYRMKYVKESARDYGVDLTD